MRCRRMILMRYLALRSNGNILRLKALSVLFEVGAEQVVASLV